jgi:hypothetical protein
MFADGNEGIRYRAVETGSGANLFNSLQATIHSSSTTPALVGGLQSSNSSHSSGLRAWRCHG